MGVIRGLLGVGVPGAGDAPWITTPWTAAELMMIFHRHIRTEV